MVLPEAVTDYARLIEQRVHFSQANYGDGEWACILGHDGANCQGEVYNPTLRDALRNTLQNPAGQWCGSNPGKKLQADVDRWVQDNNVNVPWVPKEILPSANVNGHLRPFLEAVRTRRVILVGAFHLAELDENVIGPFTYVGVPDETAWKFTGQTASKVWTLVQPHDLVLFASGMASNLVIHDLASELGEEVTLLDVGALLDPYVGVFSRNGYRKEIFQKVNILKNLGVA